jgi:hypothetical protein
MAEQLKVAKNSSEAMEAEVGAPKRPVAAAGHQQGTGQVAADPLPELVSPSGLLVKCVILGDVWALHERRQDLAGRPQAAGAHDKWVRRVLGELLWRHYRHHRRRRSLAAAQSSSDFPVIEALKRDMEE